MLKRVLIGGAFAVVVVGLLVVFLLSRTNTFENAHASQAVSDDAILYAENLDYLFLTDEFLNESPVWIELRNSSPQVQKYDSLLRSFSQVLSMRPALKELIVKEPLSLSIHLMGKSKLSAVFYLSSTDVTSRT